jgi:ABC-type branched-subunit amino acid transport system substrate-binding protein
MSGVPPRYGRRKFLQNSALTAGAFAFGGALAGCGPNESGSSGGGGGGGREIKIGGLIPFTGLETHNGKAMQYGIEIGADEINKAGGIAGGKVKLSLADSAASVDQGVQKAQALITQEHVDLINGTLLSNVRAAVFDVCKKAGMPFMNPTFYEGGLCSEYYFSAGAPPNQTIDPLAAYAVEKLGKKFYFIGSDYVWGTGSIKAAKSAVAQAGGTVVGAPRFVPLGTTDFSAEIRRIQAAKPDIVWPFVAGQDGITFLKQLTDAGVRSDVHIVADYIDELIVPALSPETYTGIVNCSTYFMSVDSPENQKFLETLKGKYGGKAKISSFGMEMYNNMKLLQVAAKDLDKWV